jgi:ribose-phosphate pyrophosphokinase
VDDICDGGYTFIELAKALEARLEPYFGADFKLDLWVSHGLFTKGYQDLSWHYDTIETTNSWNFNGLYNMRPDGVNDNKVYFHPVQGIMA